MATDGTIIPPLYSGDSVPLTAGMLVRASGTNGVVRAQADSSGHVLGYIGVVLAGEISPTGAVPARAFGHGPRDLTARPAAA